MARILPAGDLDTWMGIIAFGTSSRPPTASEQRITRHCELWSGLRIWFAGSVLQVSGSPRGSIHILVPARFRSTPGTGEFWSLHWGITVLKARATRYQLVHFRGETSQFDAAPR
jgi:hypothetical protein